MKRTEAIQKIKDLLNGGFDPNHTDEQANNFLIELQDTMGMKPPRLPEIYCQALMSVYMAGYTFYQWEEDIEKDAAVMAVVKRKQEREDANRSKYAARNENKSS